MLAVQAKERAEQGAATRIQSQFRGKAARDEVTRLREERLAALAREAEAENERAAEAEAKRKAAAEAAAAEEERLRLAAAEEEERIRQQTAAREIQRLGRGYMSRQRVSALRRQRLLDLEAEALSAAPRRRVRRGGSRASHASHDDA